MKNHDGKLCPVDIQVDRQNLTQAGVVLPTAVVLEILIGVGRK
jgi:hypothetical protein